MGVKISLKHLLICRFPLHLPPSFLSLSLSFLLAIYLLIKLGHLSCSVPHYLRFC